jgi:putative membrane protein
MNTLVHAPFWWFPFSGVLWIVVVATVIWLVLRGVGARPWPPQRSAREILDERLAHGEIGKGEYRERLEELRSDR